jgi:hypothetical protein
MIHRIQLIKQRLIGEQQMNGKRIEKDCAEPRARFIVSIETRRARVAVV